MKVLTFFNSLALILVFFTCAGFAQSTFTNSATISIKDPSASSSIGAANPYPSNITVSGMTGTVSDINVRLNGLSHTNLSDIAFLLVSPDTSKRFVLLSDCGDFSVSNVTITFDDQAAGLVPCGTSIPTGSYRPTSRPFNGTDIRDDFPSPAPQPAESYSQPAPTGTATLNNTFNGVNPNGVWSLYVVDYEVGDVGAISGGYSLTITTNGSNSVTPTPTPVANFTITGTLLNLPNTAGASVRVSGSTFFK